MESLHRERAARPRLLRTRENDSGRSLSFQPYNPSTLPWNGTRASTADPSRQLMNSTITNSCHNHFTRMHRKWIETRFLTERIRVSFYFALCDLDVSPIKIPPYLRVAHQPDDWMVRVFNEIWERLPSMRGSAGTSCNAIAAFVRTSLVQN